MALANAQVPNMEPPAEIKKLDWMIGDWSGNVKMSVEGMEFEGEMVYKVGWSGQFIKMSSVWNAAGMRMTDEGFMGWDASKGKYSSYTFSNMSPVPRIEWGEMKGDALVFVSEPWAEGSGAPPTTSRATLTMKSKSEMDFLLEFNTGDTWTKVGSAVFRKK